MVWLLMDKTTKCRLRSDTQDVGVWISFAGHIPAFTNINEVKDHTPLGAFLSAGMGTGHKPRTVGTILKADTV